MITIFADFFFLLLVTTSPRRGAGGGPTVLAAFVSPDNSFMEGARRGVLRFFLLVDAWLLQVCDIRYPKNLPCGTGCPALTGKKLDRAPPVLYAVRQEEWRGR